jgi:hypothetical protein
MTVNDVERSLALDQTNQSEQTPRVQRRGELAPDAHRMEAYFVPPVSHEPTKSLVGAVGRISYSDSMPFSDQTLTQHPNVTSDAGARGLDYFEKVHSFSFRTKPHYRSVVASLA